MDSRVISHLDIAEAVPSLVFIADRTGRFLHVNARWIEYTGRDAESFRGEGPGELEGIIHPDDIDRTRQAWEESVHTGRPFEIQYRLRSIRDGRYRRFLARAVPVRDEGGAITHWAGVATEIEEQVRASEGLRFLSDATIVLSSSSERDAIVAAFVELAIERFSDGCAIVFTDREQPRLAALGHSDERVREALHSPSNVLLVPDAVIERVTDRKQPVLISHGTDGDHLRNVECLEIRSLIVVPMIVGDRLVGTASFISSQQTRRFDDKDVAIASAAVRQLGVALENARSLERFRILARSSERLFADGDTHEKLRSLLGILVEGIADWAAIYTLGPGGSIRLQEIAHRDPVVTRSLEDVIGQRIFNVESEGVFHDALSKRRAMLRIFTGVERLREMLQPYVRPILARVTPRTMLTVPLFTRDHVYGALSIYARNRTFGDYELELMEEISRRVALSFEHDESVERERRLTETLQEATLPSQLAEIPGASVSTVYVPATTSGAEVGGDWYDVFEPSEGRFLLSIGDVTGRGLQASAIMGKVRHSINVVAVYEKDPARILDAAEKVVRRRYPDALATTFIAVYDVRSEMLTFANAGHPHPLLRLSHGSVEPLIAEGLPIGLRSLAKPASSRTRGMKDVVFAAFYTDGVIEGDRDIFGGERRLRDLIAHRGAPFVSDPAKMIASVCLPKKAQDDAAILVVTFPRAMSWRLFADDARAANDARAAFVEHLRGEGIGKDECDTAELIFGELVANVVRHAPGSIDIALEWRDGRAVLHVTDRGGGFEAAPHPADVLTEGGRGLWLIERFGGAVDVEPVGGYGTHVEVTLPVYRGDSVAAWEPV